MKQETFACQNCEWEGTNPEEADDPESRHIDGDIYSTSQCPKCGCLVQPKARHYVVVGRIPGDDEDSWYDFHGEFTVKELWGLFEREMYAADPNADPDRVHREYGATIFVNAIFESSTEITSVS